MPSSKNHKGYLPSPQFYVPCSSMYTTIKSHFWSNTDSQRVQSAEEPNSHFSPCPSCYTRNPENIKWLAHFMASEELTEIYLILSSSFLFSMVSLISKLPSSVLRILIFHLKLVHFTTLQTTLHKQTHSKINGQINRVQK